MNPTKAAGGGNKIGAGFGAKTVRSTGAASKTSAATGTQSAGSSEASQVSQSVGVTNQLIEATRAEVKRVDASMIQTLKAAIESGSFVLRTDALADRMVEDSMGSELLGDTYE